MCVKLNQVEYSKDYLKKVLDECLETYDENIDTFYRAYIDVRLNRAVVEVDEQTLSLRSTNDDSSPLVFKLGSPTYVCSTDITSGELLTNKRSNSISDLFNHINFSAGIGMTTFAGKDAIAACGHKMKINDKIYLGNTHIGTVTYVSYSNYAKGDYSIITLNENGESTYNLLGMHSNYNSGLYQISQNAGTYAPSIGEYVFKCTKNSGVAAFIIEGLDVRIYAYDKDNASASPVIIDGQTSAGLMSAEAVGVSGETVKPGDSGSGIFYYSDGKGSLRIGDYFCGVISTYDTNTLSLSFTPTSRIQAHGTIKISKPKRPLS